MGGFQDYAERNATNTDGSYLAAKLPGEAMYHMVIASETVPSPSGERETFEFDLRQSRSKGVVEGKPTINPINFNVLNTKDNIYRLEQYKGKTLDYMTVYGNNTSLHFIGRMQYSPADAEAGLLQLRVTITPMSVDGEMLLDCRDLVEPVVMFVGALPATATVEPKKTITIDASTIPTEATITANSNSTVCTTSVSEKVVTITGGSSTGTALVTITGSAENYGTWSTIVEVEVKS